MGGRGASSGISNKGNRYKTQYHTILTDGNIKFVAKNNRHSEALYETMTRGRVYVEVGGKDLLRIYYFDNQNKRSKQIDLKPPKHDGKLPHVHHGYEHDNNISVSNLTDKEKKLLERVKKKWYNYLNGK